MTAATHKEQTLCGQRAVEAALRTRLEHVRRLFYGAEHSRTLQPVLKQLAARRAIFRELPDDELTRVAGTRAHQGLVAVLDLPDVPVLARTDVEAAVTQPGVTVLLDGVGNPHNVGAIARTAAFLGARALWLTDEGAACVRSTAAYRTAEGGLESLPVALATRPRALVETWLAGGGQAVALSVHATHRLDEVAKDRPVLLVLGSEEQGLHADVEAACPTRVRIDGTGAVESLNVSVAAGIALAALNAR